MEDIDLCVTTLFGNAPKSTRIFFSNPDPQYDKDNNTLHIETDEQVYYASLEEENKLREWLNKRHEERGKQ